MNFLRSGLVRITIAICLCLGTSVATAEDTSWPRTIKHEAGGLILKTKPKRIVSTTPSVTGILLAIGAPVTATAAATPSPLTDNKGFFSQWADVADQRGVKILYKNLKFDIEAVIGANPDLVVVSATGQDSAAQHYAELKAQGVPAIVVNYSNRSWQEIATEIGKAAGLEEDAVKAIKRFDTHVAEVAATLALPAGTATIVGYNIAGSYSIGRPESPQASVLAALGFKIAGIPSGLAREVTRRTEFEFISRENLSAAITGETVFLLRGTDDDVKAFMADPVLANLPAVMNKRVYPLGITSFRIDYYSGRRLIDDVAAYFRKP
jgi:iron complex transport system substrate-binding protein